MKNMKKEKVNENLKMEIVNCAPIREAGKISISESEQLNHRITTLNLAVRQSSTRQGRGLLCGKAPPGRARSPGAGKFPFRDHPPDGTKGILLSKYNYEFTMNIKEFTMCNNLNINILTNNKNKYFFNNKFFNY
jgi:hypothetical protein